MRLTPQHTSSTLQALLAEPRHLNDYLVYKVLRILPWSTLHVEIAFEYMCLGTHWPEILVTVRIAGILCGCKSSGFISFTASQQRWSERHVALAIHLRMKIRVSQTNEHTQNFYNFYLGIQNMLPV